MADDSPSPGQPLPLSAARRHDRLCDDFEALWLNGSPGRIEEWLPTVPPEERAALFEALLRVELEYRPAAAAKRDEYLSRFPEFGGLIASLIPDPAADTVIYGAPAADPIVPPVLPGYEMLGYLGAGGMGVVYRARDLELERLVAVKVIKSGARSRPDELRRFHIEARSVAGLNHPNIVRLFAFGHVGGTPYFVMEYVETGSHAARLRGRPSDPVWAAGLVEALARGVQYVHDQQIVHRDLKPANILLTANGTPKIADFGLAKRLTADDPQLTASRAVLGSACYMAPEQARGEKDVGRAADVYALGAILFELLTGRPPFRADSYELTVVQLLTEDPPRPTALVPNLPVELEAVCLKCLEKEPARRYATATALADDLGRFRDGLPVTVLPLQVFDHDARWARKLGYEITEAINSSPLEFAYLARRVSVGQSVVLHRSAGTPGSPQHQAMRREAEALARLDHPNVIRLYDFGERFEQTYLITEFIEGGTSLHRRLRGHAREVHESPLRPIVKGTPFEPRRAAEVTLRIALGVQAIHEAGILHCGLNSRCIVLTRDDVPKIGGFTAAIPRGEMSVTSSGEAQLNHCPPELLGGNVAPTVAADIYGVGVVLYDLLTGLPSFLAATVAKTRELILLTAPVPPSRYEPSVPAELEAICLRCLAKQPTDRYGSAGELALDLQRFLTAAEPESLSTISEDPPQAVTNPAAVFQLRIHGGPHDVGKSFQLPRRRAVIGRSKDCDILLRDEGRMISREHCVIVWSGETGKHELIDLGGRNGTTINGRRVRTHTPLAAGDQIGVTKYVLVFESYAPPAAESNNQDHSC